MDTTGSNASYLDCVFQRCKLCSKLLTLTVAFVILQTTSVEANWMLIGMSSIGLDVHQDTGQCSLVQDLVLEQTRICEANPQAMPCVGLGVVLGLQECKHQFSYERWNCSSNAGPSPNGPVLNTGTKETAFAYAVTSAGVVHAVTRACSAGNLTDCSCDISRQGLPTKEGWTWGGCSDNVDYGVYFARTFIDAPDRIKKSRDEKDIIALMNLHNNEVGRRTVADGMVRKCRCHGVSGSCAVKTCWDTMPPFREIGSVLKEKYATSVELSSRAAGQLRARSKRMRRKVVGSQDLVYVKNSPNYCRRSRKRGITGTKGRECKLYSSGSDSCESLCCGRGYNTRVEKLLERCHCKFLWCCEVKCKVCETVKEKYYCK